MKLGKQSGLPSLRRLLQKLALVMVAGALAAPQSAPTRFTLLLCAAQTPSVLDSNRGFADAALSEAETALEAERFDQALAKCQEALKLDPKSARAYYLVGLIEVEQGKDDEAQKALLQSIELGPSNNSARVELGKLYVRSKQWRFAEREFRAALKLGDATGSSDFGLALALVRQSRVSEALPHLAAAVRADPKDPEKLLTLIAAEFKVKQIASAERHVVEIETLAPRDPWMFHQLGNILHENQRLDESRASLERSAELLAAGASNSSRGLTLSGLFLEIAWVRFEQHDFGGALQSLEKFDLANATPQDRARALDLQGNAWLAAGRIDDARERLRQAAETDPSEVAYVLHWAWAELMAGDLETATKVATTAKIHWPQAPEIAMLLAVLSRERVPARARVPFTADWHLKGEGLVCCPCTVPCPCRSNAPPTHKHCENTGVFHVAQGHYGDVRLDGLTFASVQVPMNEGSVPSTIYVDASARDEQLIALERIYQSFKPLQPFVLLSIKRVPLALLSPDEKSYEVNVRGLLEIKIRRQLDEEGKPQVETAALDYFSNRLEYARNLVYKVWNPDGGLRWDYSGRQANFRTIDLDLQDYREGRMLIQFTGGSGFFNKKQLELIKSLKLPTLRSYPKPGSSSSN